MLRVRHVGAPHIYIKIYRTMKPPLGFLLLLVAPLALSPLAEAGGGNLIGTLPDKATIAQEVDTRTTTGSKKKVKPNEKKCNGDGVCVDNKSKRGKNITMTPGEGEGDADSATTVTTPTGASSDITGIDGNDTVTLGSSNVANITGTGGAINVSGGSTVIVTNSGGASASAITVHANGITITVPPGSSTTVGT